MLQPWQTTTLILDKKVMPHAQIKLNWKWNFVVMGYNFSTNYFNFINLLILAGNSQHR